jgi:integrase
VKIPRVYISDGAWYYVQDLEERNPKTGRPKQKWIKLARVDAGEAALHEALSKLFGRAVDELGVGNMPGFITEFRGVYLKSLTPDVAKDHGRMLDVISKAFRRFDVDQVEPGHVIKFLSDNFSDTPTARRSYKARLSSFFSWCVLNRGRTKLMFNPCREVKVKQPPKRRGRFTPEIFWRLHDRLSPMGQCFMMLTFYTRQRPTEIRRLRESMIGPTKIHFKPSKVVGSSGEVADILITPEIRYWLERARQLRRELEGDVVELDRRRDPFIIVSRDGGAYTKNGMYEVWRCGCHPHARGEQHTSECIHGVTTRDLRAYALSQMEAQGYTLREIQTSAAHTDLATTQIYLDQYRERLSEARLVAPARPAKT